MDSRRYRVKSRHTKRPWLRYGLWVLAVLLALFVLGNIVMWFAYRERVLPNVKAAHVPETVTLVYEQTRVEFAAKEAGISVDRAATEEQLKTQRSWLPLVDVLIGRTVPSVVDVQKQKLAESMRKVEPNFVKAALPKRVVFQGDKFAIAEPEAGYRLNEARFVQQVPDAFARGQDQLTVPTIVTDAKEYSGVGIEEELAKLNKQLQTKITFTVNGQAKQPSVADIGSWYEPSALPSTLTMSFSAGKTREYINSLAPSVHNAGDAAEAAGYALSNGQEITFVIATDQTPVKYTYCVSGKEVGEGHMPGFIAKVAAVLGDPRGWNAGGKIGFERVESGCDFSLWLSAPSQMTSFGGLCDPFWSCRSGRNVVINFDRWQGATDAWNAAGGGLEDYRVMVTNHEVGHWLGFGHRNCPGPGQPAPVMMQQSIDLKGCAFNPWPVAAELDTLKQSKGLAALQPREEYLAEAPCCCAHCARV